MKVSEIDAADQIPNLQWIGAAVAKAQVKQAKAKREAFRKFSDQSRVRGAKACNAS